VKAERLVEHRWDAFRSTVELLSADDRVEMGCVVVLAEVRAQRGGQVALRAAWQRLQQTLMEISRENGEWGEDHDG